MEVCTGAEPCEEEEFPGALGTQSWDSGCPWHMQLLHRRELPQALADPFPPFSSSKCLSRHTPSPHPSLSGSYCLSQPSITSHLLGIQSGFWVCPPHLYKYGFPNPASRGSAIRLCFCLGHLTRYITASSVFCPPPAAHTLFPAAKIACSPLPHPRRAYKFRAPSLLTCSFSVIQ